MLLEAASILEANEDLFPALAVSYVFLHLPNNRAGVENIVLIPAPGRKVLPVGAVGICVVVGRVEGISPSTRSPHAPPFLLLESPASNARRWVPGTIGKTLPNA